MSRHTAAIKYIIAPAVRLLDERAHRRSDTNLSYAQSIVCDLRDWTAGVPIGAALEGHRRQAERRRISKSRHPSGQA